MFHTKYALATLSWTGMQASLRVCAQHSPAVFSQVVKVSSPMGGSLVLFFFHETAFSKRDVITYS
jgi:hypothetical protein